MSTRSRQHPKRRSQVGPPLSPAAVPGVPRKVSKALDALDEPNLTASEVAFALWGYLNVLSKPSSALSGENNDWLEFEVPYVRGVLEGAMDALPERHASHLLRIVSRADDQLLARTFNDYRADQSWPWWARRWRPCAGASIR